MCIENPKYLSKMLGHDSMAGTGLTSLDQKKEFLKYLYKAWSGLTKSIHHQITVNGKQVDFPLLGRFFYRKQIVNNYTNPEGSKSKDKVSFMFVPHIDFINSGRFSFPQNLYNVSPLSKKVPKVATHRIQLGAIGDQCEYDPDIVFAILKDVMV